MKMSFTRWVACYVAIALLSYGWAVHRECYYESLLFQSGGTYSRNDQTQFCAVFTGAGWPVFWSTKIAAKLMKPN